jgi:hypothetical protein
MRKMISVGIGLALAPVVFPAMAANKGPGKAPPACSAIGFHSLAPGMTDGNHEAGMYKSRYGRLELHGDVKQGAPVDYFVVAAGKRIAAVSGNLPEAAASCAAAKKMPKPEAPASSCTGQRFRVVVAHAGDQRVALLYAGDSGSWHFCSAGTF